MPTITDATIVNLPLNALASARPQRLSNGWLIVAVAELISGDSFKYHFYKSQDEGTTWSLVGTHNDGGLSKNYYSIATKGLMVYFVYAYSTQRIKFISFDVTNYIAPTPININTVTHVDMKGGIDLKVDEKVNEIHIAFSAKHQNFADSFNISYAKGAINSDGSVTWGTVEQVTKINGVEYGNFAIAPSIVIHNNNVLIVVESQSAMVSGGAVSSTSKGIVSFNKQSGNTSQWVSPGWFFKNIFDIRDRLQFKPSTIVHGGLIATAWHGKDDTHLNTDYVRFSKSADGGITWSAMQKIVPGRDASLTANRAGKLFITYADANDTKRIESADYGDTWSTPVTIGNGWNASTLYDIGAKGFNYSEPLTVRQDSTKVLFSGKWTITAPSIPEGSIGQKTIGDNLLTYAITTDGSMSPITEKLNGQVLNTRSAPVSGQQYTVALTEAQWEAVKYGKYANAKGSLNELIIEMGTDKWTYTFDKRLSNEADMLATYRASIDTANVSTPAKKSKIINAVRSKGGTVADGATTEEIAEAIKGMTGGRNAEGASASNAQAKLIVNGLGFRPSIIRWYSSDKSGMGYWDSQMPTNYVKLVSLTTGNSSTVSPISGVVITDNGFEVTVDASKTYTWYASE